MSCEEEFMFTEIFNRLIYRNICFALLVVGTATMFFVSGCSMSESEGIADSKPAATTVKMDFFHKPLPEIAMPNDIATVVDSSSATGRRINASMVAPTGFERRTREL